MRLAMPHALIPASLDVDGLDGLKERLDAGANVVTSIVPPEKGLAGVAHSTLDIEDSRRNLDHILPVLTGCGLEPATAGQYRDWVAGVWHWSAVFPDRDGPSEALTPLLD